MTTQKPEFDPVADFLPRLVGVIKTLRDNAKDHPELLAYVGSLASDIVERGGKKNWTELKAALSNEAYDGLLKDCQTQAAELNKRGDQGAAYVVEIIATSIIASRFNEQKISEGNKLLDDIINQSARAYQTAKTQSAGKTSPDETSPTN